MARMQAHATIVSPRLTVLAASKLLTGSKMSSSSARGESRRCQSVPPVSDRGNREYVALEKLEGMYALNPLFATLLVHGDSTRSSIVAVAVLDPVNTAGLIKHVLGKSVSPTDVQAMESLITDVRVRKEVLKGFAKVARQQRLNG